MAAPPEITTLALSGTFVMNKTLSDSTERVLELQGVGWWMRKTIGLATVTLHVKHYKDDGDVEHIDIRQTLTGGIEGTQENRVLDWTERSHRDRVFGDCIGKSRRIKVEEIEDTFLKEGWLPDTHADGAIHATVKSDTEKSGLTWNAEQIWGFEEINGERRYVRHLNFTHPDENIKAKLIYDYVGKLEED